MSNEYKVLGPVLAEEVKQMEVNLGDEALLEDEEAALLLKVSARTVQRLRLKKKIKSVRITSKISRIKVAHVKEYLRKLERAA